MKEHDNTKYTTFTDVTDDSEFYDYDDSYYFLDDIDDSDTLFNFYKDENKVTDKDLQYLESLSKSDTLVVHCADRSTDMLSQVYEDKRWDVIRDGSINKDILHQLLEKHDRLIFLGHGTGYGLINVQKGGYVIGPAEAPYLKDKKIFAIWCNADKYFTQHNLGKGCFITKNVPSEVWEARAVGYNVSTQYILDNITYWSKCCADVVEDALNGNAKLAVEKARKAYQDIYGPNGTIGKNSDEDELGVTAYNTDAIQVQR